MECLGGLNDQMQLDLKMTNNFEYNHSEFLSFEIRRQSPSMKINTVSPHLSPS